MINDAKQEEFAGIKGILRQGGRYLIVGISSAVIEVFAFTVLFYLIGIPIWLSNPASLLISTVFNFALSSTWSFKGSTNLFRSGILYTLLFAFNMCFSSFAGTALLDLGVPGIIAKLIPMACNTIWNFFLYRKVIFI